MATSKRVTDDSIWLLCEFDVAFSDGREPVDGCVWYARPESIRGRDPKWPTSDGGIGVY